LTISGKKYRIKSGSRFILFVALIAVITVTSANSIIGSNYASSLTEKDYIEIKVQYGDTLWNIAQTYMPERSDVRRSVFTLCQINGISAHELQAGQTLLVPVH